MNTEIARGGLHALTAAIAGPALIWAGLQYPGNGKAKVFLVGTGVILLVSHYAYFQAEVDKKRT